MSLTSRSGWLCGLGCDGAGGRGGEKGGEVGRDRWIHT